MKIKIQLAAIVLLMAGFMSSCIMKDDFADCPPKKPLRVVSTIDFGDGTTLWPKGSDIGITVFKAGTNECFGNNSDKHYLISDTQTGESVPEESGDPIYLPEGEEEADIIAYYPYTTPFDKNYKAHLSVLDQSQPDSLDLITSDRVCNVPSDTELVELKFYRRLTKLVFNITMIEVGPDGKETVVNHQLPGTKLDITGMPVSGDYSLPDNILTLDDNTKDISTPINKEGTLSSAIVFPREPGKGVTFVVTLPGGTKHTFVMSPEQALKAGTENKFDLVIKIKKDVPPVEPDYKVTYELRGDLTVDNITVKQGSDNNIWNLNQTILVKKDGSFTFLYNSDLVVTAYLSDSTVLNTKNNTPYSFTHINKNIHIILTAGKEVDPPVDPEPPIDPPVDPSPDSCRVTYELQGDLTPSNITVKQGGNSSWKVGQVITVEKGDNFSFFYNSTLDVKARLSDDTTLTIWNNLSYSFTDIQKDIHIILWAKDEPEIPWYPEEEEPTHKPDAEPDLVVKADVHIWVVFKEVDGGVILPDKDK